MSSALLCCRAHAAFERRLLESRLLWKTPTEEIRDIGGVHVRSPGSVGEIEKGSERSYHGAPARGMDVLALDDGVQPFVRPSLLDFEQEAGFVS